MSFLISDHDLDPCLRIWSYLWLLFGSLCENKIGMQSEKKNSDYQYWIWCWSEFRAWKVEKWKRMLNDFLNFDFLGGKYHPKINISIKQLKCFESQVFGHTFNLDVFCLPSMKYCNVDYRFQEYISRFQKMVL